MQVYKKKKKINVVFKFSARGLITAPCVGLV